MSESKAMYSSWQGEVGTVSNKDNNTHEIQLIRLNELTPFKNHPFKVETDTELFELMQSIENDGVLVPLIARAKSDGDGFELIAGHRRKAACEWVGIMEAPVIVRELDDNQAIIIMVNSNLQREHIKPSEKAFAYKMRLDAMKRQGMRTDLTFSQVEKKLDDPNPTLQLSEVGCGNGKDGIWGLSNVETERENKYSNDILAKQVGESRAQISRYIRLAYLIPKILDMVDEGKIAFTIAVELSYLKEEEQYDLHAVMDLEQCTPSLSQANRMKRRSQSGKLDVDAIYDVLGEEKPNQRLQIKIQSEKLDKYFPANYTERQKVELIETLVKDWHELQLLKNEVR